MKHLFRFFAVLCVTAIGCLSMTACFTAPNVVVPDTPATEATTETTEPIVTKATVPVPEGQLSLSLIMGIMSADMKWSELSGFEHTATDGTHATFTVADGYGKSCELAVTFDEATDTVSAAKLSYGNTAVNILCDDTIVIRDIMIAMNKE